MANKNYLRAIVICIAMILASAVVAAQPALDVSSNFFAPGWEGDSADATFTGGWTDNPHPPDPTCIQLTYSPSNSAVQDYVKVFWLYPASNWGKERGLDLSKYKELTFYARGNGKRVEFGAGGIGGSVKSPASIIEDLELNTWKMYKIDLGSQDLSNVIAGFYCQVSKKDNPNGCEIYLSDMTYQ